jgi:hypothetical protein
MSKDGRTVIQVADTAHPAEAFYHELLHADLENSGYIPYRVVLTVVPKGLQPPGLLGALDNELQHHRIFGRYMAAGLAPESFYADTDADDFRGVPAKVRELTKGSSPRDRIYGTIVKRRLRAMAIRDKPTAPASPWQNGFAERLIGSIRRECVDHFVVLGEAHLRRILRAYARYYNDIRTHWSLAKDAPVSRPIQRTGSIRSCAILGGLHHHYVRV